MRPLRQAQDEVFRIAKNRYISDLSNPAHSDMKEVGVAAVEPYLLDERLVR